MATKGETKSTPEVTTSSDVERLVQIEAEAAALRAKVGQDTKSTRGAIVLIDKSRDYLHKKYTTMMGPNAKRATGLAKSEKQFTADGFDVEKATAQIARFAEKLASGDKNATDFAATLL